MRDEIKFIYKWHFNDHFTITQIRPEVFRKLNARLSINDLWVNIDRRFIIELGENYYVSWYGGWEGDYEPFE